MKFVFNVFGIVTERLILCQLVPFAQVVLLTAMEFLRDEKQEEEDDVLESKNIQQTKSEIEKGEKPLAIMTVEV